MRKVLWSALFFLFGLSAIGQNFYQQPLKEVLSSTKSNAYIAVEGYYVDNSSFMVTRSSDVSIAENTRYPVYEYKYQLNLYNKNHGNMTEVPVFTKKEMQGESCMRILFLNKKRTTRSQLVVDELAMSGMSIVGDTAKYVQSSDSRIYTASINDLRDFLFHKGMMPEIEEGRNSLN
uniref:hypothetical protein n=1 Tax=uncultured Dysgonomonas sp. TaxID=206096 RepID=UPI002602AEA7|nr:hypothetical protein [uncultured Dysgonomonas sp.]